MVCHYTEREREKNFHNIYIRSQAFLKGIINSLIFELYDDITS